MQHLLNKLRNVYNDFISGFASQKVTEIYPSLFVTDSKIIHVLSRDEEYNYPFESIIKITLIVRGPDFPDPLLGNWPLEKEFEINIENEKYGIIHICNNKLIDDLSCFLTGFDEGKAKKGLNSEDMGQWVCYQRNF